MTTETSTDSTRGRRAELLAIAADLFAEKGFKNTTVRDIADASGILSGSLYHHFDSKESMVDEILVSFQEELFAAYDEVLASGDDARTKIERAVRLSFRAIHEHRHEVAIFQNEADYLGGFERFGYLAERNAQSRQVWMTLLTEGVRTGALRPDLEHRADLPVHPRHRLGGRPVVPPGRRALARGRRRPVPAHPPRRDRPWLRPTSSTRSARPWAGAVAPWPACTPPTWPRTRWPRWCERTGIDPGAVDDVLLGCCDTIGSQAGDVARTAWLVAGLPDHVPGVTIDRQCGSSQQAVHFAAQGVMSGTQDLVVAGGVQNMSRDPDLGRDAGGPAVRLLHAVRRVARLAGEVRRPGGQPVPLRGDDRREVGHRPRGDGGASRSPPTNGRARRSPRAASPPRSSR